MIEHQPGEPPGDRGEDGGAARRVVLVPATDVHDDIPTWAWEADGAGRIPTSAITLFAGRPGTGKSSAARWFAAQATRGTLPGLWLGRPQLVAYIVGEEARSVVKAGLRAAGADLDRVVFPEVHSHDGAVALRPSDTTPLTNALADTGITLVVLDPLMAAFTGSTDVHRNNEVRGGLDPWRRYAERVHGAVLGVVHLNKSAGWDVLAGITGSGAFGEVARAVFGFAEDRDGTHVLTQVKNSLGPNWQSWRYDLPEVAITADTGRTGTAVRFAMLGTSARSANEILQDAARDRTPSARRSSYDEILDWLRTVLTGGPILATELFDRADADEGWSKDQLGRARRAADKAGQPVAEVYRPENPGPSWWRLAGGEAQCSSPDGDAPSLARGGTPELLHSAALSEVETTMQHNAIPLSGEHNAAQCSSQHPHAREVHCAPDSAGAADTDHHDEATTESGMAPESGSALPEGKRSSAVSPLGDTDGVLAAAWSGARQGTRPDQRHQLPNTSPAATATAEPDGPGDGTAAATAAESGSGYGGEPVRVIEVPFPDLKHTGKPLSARAWMQAHLQAVIDAGYTSILSITVYEAGMAKGYKRGTLATAVSRTGLVAEIREAQNGGPATWVLATDARRSA